MALMVTIMAVGRLKSGPEEELVRRYADRFARSGSALGLTFGGIVEVPEARHDTAAARKRRRRAMRARPARAGPTSRARRCVPAYPGMIPRLISG